jgi:hypothetical protein
VTEHEIRQLLAVAMAYDNRKPGAATIAAWTEAAHRGHWTFPAALNAIHAHYAESTDFLMPGHITARIRNQRPLAPLAADVLQITGPRPASDETRSRAMEAFIRTLVRHRAMPVSRGERRPARNSADHITAREQARAELAALRKDPA